MVVSTINKDLQNVSVIRSVGTVAKAVAISASELAVASIHYSKSVGLVGEIIYHKLKSVRDEAIADNAIVASEPVEANNA